MKPVSKSNMLSQSNKEKYKLLGNKIRRISAESVVKPTLNNNMRIRIYSEAGMAMGPKYNMPTPKRPTFKELLKRIQEMMNAMKTFLYIERVFSYEPVFFMIKDFQHYEIQSLQSYVLYKLSNILEIKTYNTKEYHEILMRIMGYNNKSKTKRRVVNALWGELLSQLNVREIKLLKELSLKSKDYAQEWKIQFHPGIMNSNTKFNQELLVSQIHNNMKLLNSEYKKRVKQSICKNNS